MMINIVAIEDDMMFLIGLEQTLKKEPFNLIGKTDNVTEGMQLLRKTNPDLVIIDMSLKQGESGVTALSSISRSLPHLKSLVLTASSQFELALKCLSVGADGYLIKGQQPENIRAVIKTVYEGGIYLDPSFKTDFNHYFTFPNSHLIHSATSSESKEILQKFSAAELEVFQLIGNGYTNKQIATITHKPIDTIKSIIVRIFHKLNLKNRTLVALKAYELGLIA
ncbi:two component transcriptional regulator, LuxR family (plasmid) [Gloeothece citriformis PCC 7424]|uniref:Two component transcriptional regulator, LuxR family n=1 Tax=Gloeothece citriformis (strain PCC 7424) TaxID=65393 RepID=B7KLR4_GLOC7|nr:response regulator transcription factor [Gloeothece citriformis]ACK73736.1 two component transcriptional regulator, LuxR family [Gloeothece citriformis PCC 7424]